MKVFFYLSIFWNPFEKEMCRNFQTGNQQSWGKIVITFLVTVTR
jgi:hypothetical protein